uniref:S41 family peptidase n=1 Tax=Ningiella ruwaisensis TaxID=2364274 RepID=UPI00109FC307|nr:S41 family peptidase [Ningiella ruwaisensis]
MNAFFPKPRLSLAFLFCVLFIAACGGGSGGTSTPLQPPVSQDIIWQPGIYPPSANFAAQCVTPRSGVDPFSGQPFPDQAGSALAEKMWLRSWTNETYLWYDEVPDNNPNDFSISAYFNQLKTNERTASGRLKDNFHFSEPTSEYRERTQAGTSSEYGIRWEFIANTAPRELIVRYTEPNSPAAQADIPRGASLKRIDGIDFVNTTSSSEVDAINAALFPDEAGESHEFEFQLLDGSTLNANLTSAVIDLSPVQNVDIIDTEFSKIGYIQFNSFITPAQDALIDAFQAFVDNGVSELVLDLRYNGGGSLALSSQLAYMIAGPNQTNNAIFEQLVYNDKTPPEDPFPFYSQEIDYVNGRFLSNTLPSPEFTRVFILSTGSTCSASESLINGLRGIDVEVILIGDTTCGKPFGFLPTDNCGTTYFTIQFQGINEKGFGNFSDGFIPSLNPQFDDEVEGCFVDDDFSNALGSTDEALLSAALFYAEFDGCPANTSPVLSIDSAAQEGKGPAIMAPNPYIEAIINDDRRFISKSSTSNGEN